VENFSDELPKLDRNRGLLESVPQAMPECFESYGSKYDDVFQRGTQREHFRTYLAGLLSESARKNISVIAANTVGSSYYNLHHFIHDSPWSAESLNERRIDVIWQTRQTRPTVDFKLIIDDSGHRKSGTATEGVSRQYIGQIGKVDNGMVEVTSHIYDGVKGYPLDVRMYKPASRLEKGKEDPEFQKKPQLAIDLVDKCLKRGLKPGCVLLDAGYGNNAPTFSEATEVDYFITNAQAHVATAVWIAQNYSDRNWIEVFYRETKGWLGMAEYQVRDQRSIERHWILVFTAFTFLACQRFSGGLRRQWSAEPLTSFAQTFRVFRHAVECQFLTKWLPGNWNVFSAHRAKQGLSFA
jgi:hypothetical protein